MFSKFKAIYLCLVRKNCIILASDKEFLNCTLNLPEGTWGFVKGVDDSTFLPEEGYEGTITKIKDGEYVHWTKKS